MSNRAFYAVCLTALALVVWGVTMAPAQVVPGSPYYRRGNVFGSPILLPDGTAAAPALAFSNNSNLGIYRDVANVIKFSVLGVGRAVIGSADFRLTRDISVSWTSSTTDPAGAADLAIARGGTTGALRVLSGTAPTLSGCGTSPAISGNNTLGTVTIGATPGTCVVTFNGTWTNIPKCFLQNRTSAQLVRAISNTTTAFTMSGTIAEADDIDYWCVSS